MKKEIGLLWRGDFNARTARERKQMRKGNIEGKRRKIENRKTTK